jgi:hypothetical protein
MAEANNKVYYGEYSLQRWIDLILSGGIVLPPYQRYFVWQEEQAIRLIKSIKNYNYLPAVTIGIGKNPGSGKKENMILDGQQRLTSILLACIGKFPKRKNPVNKKRYADENDRPADEVNDDLLSEWTFKDIVALGSDPISIRDKINTDFPNSYSDFTIEGVKITKDFLSKHFIHFAYLVPDASSSELVKSKYFANVFHSINREGTKLTPIESRAALYYQGGNYQQELEPGFSKEITANGSQMDFVRYLAFLSNYNKVGRKDTAKGYSGVSTREAFYEEFVLYYVLNEAEDNKFELNRAQYSANLAKLEHALEELGLKSRQCSSIIEMDYYFAGLIYYQLIKGVDYDLTKWEETKDMLDKLVTTVSASHKNYPGMLQYVQKRIDESVALYADMFGVTV